MEDSSHLGLHKLKMENGYVRGSRKSNSGGRNLGSSGSSGGSSNGSRKEKVVSGRERKEGVHRSSGSGGGGTGSSSGGGRGGSDGGGVMRRSASVRTDDLEELVEGWPKWLTDNVPKHALDGLVPKSADAYDKLDKVSSNG